MGKNIIMQFRKPITLMVAKASPSGEAQGAVKGKTYGNTDTGWDAVPEEVFNSPSYNRIFKSLMVKGTKYGFQPQMDVIGDAPAKPDPAAEKAAEAAAAKRRAAEEKQMAEFQAAEKAAAAAAEVAAKKEAAAAEAAAKKEADAKLAEAASQADADAKTAGAKEGE